MKGMLELPSIKEAVLGHAEVRQAYKVTAAGAPWPAATYRTASIPPGLLRCAWSGTASWSTRATLGYPPALQGRSVKEGAKRAYECGLTIDNYNDIKLKATSSSALLWKK